MYRMKRFLIVSIILLSIIMTFIVVPNIPVHAYVKKVLFDNAHLQTAGNADWTIHGGYSDFADALRASGYEVQEWGSDDPRTAQHDGDPPLTLDVLSQYDVVVIPEPNDTFTDAEKQAILSYIANGGSVFFISDHHGSDRNNNGWDSPAIFNGWHKNTHDPDSTTIYDDDWIAHLGFRFYFIQKSQDPITDLNTSHPITNGVSAIGAWGATGIAVIDPQHVTVIARYSNGTPYVIAGTYGNGRFVAIGDSSPFDDGTGTPGDDLYDGWHDLDDAKLALNIVDWLAGEVGSRPSVTIISPHNGDTVTATVLIHATASVSVGYIDTMVVYVDGSTLTTSQDPEIVTVWDASDSNPGNHTITVEAISNTGLRDRASVTVHKPSGDANIYLLIDDDNDTDAETVYEQALTDIGVGYEEITIPSGGSIPATVNLSAYAGVIWFTAQDWQTALTTSDRQRISDYVSSGGHIVIFGPELGYGAYKGGWQSWLDDTFGGHYQGGINNSQVSVIGEGMFDFSASTTGSGWMNKIAVQTGTKAAAFRMSDIYPGAPDSVAGVYKDYAIWMGWGLEQLTFGADNVMASIIQYFQGHSSLYIEEPVEGQTVTATLHLVYYSTETSSYTIDGNLYETVSQTGTIIRDINVSSLSDAMHTLQVFAGSASATVHFYKQATATVYILSPSTSTVSGTVTISASGRVIGGKVLFVKIWIDDELYKLCNGNGKASVVCNMTWQSWTVSNGFHDVKVRLYYDRHDEYVEQVKPVYVDNTGRPSIHLSFADGSYVSGTVSVVATVSLTDSDSIEWIKLYIDDNNVAVCTATTMCLYRWRVPDGKHVYAVRAVARTVSSGESEKIVEVTNDESIKKQRIYLNPGWNAIAFTVNSSSTVGDIFKDMTVMRLEKGVFYYVLDESPVIGKGYLVRVQEIQEVAFWGKKCIDPGEVTVEEGSGWFLIGVAGSQTVSVSALKGVKPDGSIVSPSAVMSYVNGVFHILNADDDMEPGMGYFVRFDCVVNKIRWH